MDGLEEATCPSCSLVVKVIYNKVRRNNVFTLWQGFQEISSFHNFSENFLFIHENKFIMWAVEYEIPV